MKSSLALDANRRVDEYRRSVLSVQENVLFFKGFLGPALRERPGMTTVGIRAARAAGVIVDADGKLRCPPGTPNANQFTDLQMSNCMVIGAAAIMRSVRGGRREIGAILAAVNEAARKEVKSPIARAAITAAVAYLQAMDYRNFEGAMGPVAMIGVDILRAGGRDVLEKTLDSLVRRGKLTPEQRAELEELLDKIHETGMPKYVAAILAKRRSRRRRKKAKKQKPDVDGSRVDATHLTPEKQKELGRLQRGRELLSARFSRKAVGEEHTAKRTRLLDTYVPDRRGKDAEDYVDSLLERMGIPTDNGPISKQLDASLDLYEKVIAKDIADLRNPELARDEAALRRRLDEAEVLAAVAEALKTKRGRKAIRQKMAENFVDALVGVEMSIQANPSLRGSFTVNLAEGDDVLGGAAAWASQHAGFGKDKGKSVLSITYSPRVLITGRKAKSYTDGDASELEAFVIDIAGEETAGANLAGLSVHEVGHIEHYMEIARSYGIDIGTNSPTLVEQVKKQGPRLADSFLGMRLAMAHGIDPEKTWESPEVQKLIQAHKPNQSFDETLGQALLRQVNYLSGYNEDLREKHRLGDVIPHFSVTGPSDRRAERLLHILSNPDTKPEFLERYVGGDAIRRLTPERMKEILADVLDGQSVDEFIQEGIEAWSSVLGFPPNLLLTRGVAIPEFKDTLHQISGYGNLNPFESVAEGRALEMFLTQYPSLSSTMSPEELRKIMDRVVPRKPVTAMPKMTPEMRAFMIRVDRILARLEKHPNLPDRLIDEGPVG